MEHSMKNVHPTTLLAHRVFGRAQGATQAQHTPIQFSFGKVTPHFDREVPPN